MRETIRIYCTALWKSAVLSAVVLWWLDGLHPGALQAGIVKTRNVTTATLTETYNQFMRWANDLNQ